MPNTDKILNIFKQQLDFQISQKTDPRFLAVTTRAYAAGKLSDDDLVESKGFYKGLKVAKEMLERIEEGETESCKDTEHISLPVTTVRELLEFTRKLLNERRQFTDWKDADDYLFANLEFTNKELDKIYKDTDILVYYNSAKKETDDD